MSDMPNIDIRPDHWEIVRDILRKHVPQYEVWAFGSRAKWTAKTYSDLDLAVITDKPLPIHVSANLSEAFSESDLPWKVDVVDWATTSESFRKVIGRDKVVVVGRNDRDKWTTHDVATLLKEKTLTINDGYRAKNSELSRIGIPFARAGNINGGFHFEDADRVPPRTLERVGVKRSRVGDVVFTSKGTVGRFAYVGGDTPEFVYSPQLCFWRSGNSEIIDSRWLYYWMNGPEFLVQFKGVSGQTDMAEYVSLQDQRKMKISIPPIAEQRGISAALGVLDDQIENLRRIRATLSLIARALFKSWFVDFDPVRERLSGGKHPSVSDDRASLFPNAFYETGLGQIPIGWVMGKLGDICNLKRGHDLPASARTPGKIPVVSSSGVSGSHVETKVHGPGVVTGRYGTIGKVFYLEEDYWPLNTTLYVDDFKGSPPRYIFHVLGNVGFENYTDKAAVPGVNRNHLHMEPVVIPPIEIRREFARLVDPIWKMHDLAERQAATISGIRDALLPRLLSGELSTKGLIQ